MADTRYFPLKLRTCGQRSAGGAGAGAAQQKSDGLTVHTLAQRQDYDLGTDPLLGFQNIEDANNPEYLATLARQYTAQSVFIAEIAPALVAPKLYSPGKQWLMLHGQHYLTDFANPAILEHEQQRLGYTVDAEQVLTFDKPVNEDITVHGACLWLPVFKNWDHTMRESLPTLLALKERGYRMPELSVFSPLPILPDYIEILESFGIRENNLISARNKWIRFEKLILTSFACSKSVHHPTDYFVRTADHLGNAFKPSDAGPRKIFISRRKARRRCLLNEDELAGIMKKMGFYVIDPGEITKAEQIALFRDAEYVVGMHGMGFANAIFARNLKMIVEITGTNWVRNSYYRTAQFRNAAYGVFIVPPLRGLCPSDAEKASPMLLGIPAFIAFLEQVWDKT